MATKAEMKDRGIRIGINQIVTYITLVPIFWFIAQPLIVKALAEDINQIVQKEVLPINNAFVALLQRDINATKREMASLRFLQRQGTTWTQEDAKYLADLEIQLDALEEAKSALESGADHS